MESSDDNIEKDTQKTSNIELCKKLEKEVGGAIKGWLFNILQKKDQLLIILLTIAFAALIILINHNQLGPASDYDWIYFTKEKIIKKDNEQIGFFSIEGLVRSKGIISPKNPAELKIFKILFNFKKETLKSYLCKDNICHDNTTAKACLEGFNARGYNKSESVDFTWERNEPACTENIILKKDAEDADQITYYNTSQNINKEVVFITSGSQSLRVDNYIYSPIVIENAFEVKPYYNYSELQLNKYAFLLALIGLIVVIMEIIKFFRSNKYAIIISTLIIIIVLIDLLLEPCL